MIKGVTRLGKKLGKSMLIAGGVLMAESGIESTARNIDVYRDKGFSAMLNAADNTPTAAGAAVRCMLYYSLYGYRDFSAATRDCRQSIQNWHNSFSEHRKGGRRAPQ